MLHTAAEGGTATVFILEYGKKWNAQWVSLSARARPARGAAQGKGPLYSLFV